MATVENHLVHLLPRKDRASLLALCEKVPLVLSDVLNVAGAATRFVYLPLDGFVSLVTTIEGRPGLEVGMVGREGMLGTQVALGIRTAPLRAVVQGAGSAWRVETDAFEDHLSACPALKRVLDRYVVVLMGQLTTSAACMRYHAVGQRLARWLLMSQDRAQSDSFKMTHEFLAYMLGVRRVGITTAAGALQQSGLIRYARGHLTVLDRPGLENAACGCYAADRTGYADLLG